MGPGSHQGLNGARDPTFAVFHLVVQGTSIGQLQTET